MVTLKLMLASLSGECQASLCTCFKSYLFPSSSDWFNVLVIGKSGYIGFSLGNGSQLTFQVQPSTMKKYLEYTPRCVSVNYFARTTPFVRGLMPSLRVAQVRQLYLEEGRG